MAELLLLIEALPPARRRVWARTASRHAVHNLQLSQMCNPTFNLSGDLEQAGGAASVTKAAWVARGRWCRRV